ncbi:MAG: DUF5667 domain-containing protein [Patescibacteria group bacterium]|nr:DUF5667 domain-containing protein [Patescibacteria group bacterium]
MKNIIKQLKKLQDIQPDQNWQKSLRNDIIMQAKDLEPQEQGFFFFNWTREVFRDWEVLPHLVRVTASVMAILIVVLSGSVFTVSASKDSLPGDTFYSVKLASEKIQLSLAQEEDKIELGLKFAGRRLDEANQLLTKDPNRVSESLSAFEKNIQDAKLSLEKAHQVANQTQDKVKIVEVAKMASQEVENYEKTLNKFLVEDETVSVAMNDEINQKIVSSLDSTSQVNLKSLEILIANIDENKLNGDKQQILDKISQELVKLEAKNLDEKLNVLDVQQDLNTAKELIAEENLAGALEKVQQTKIKIDQATTGIDSVVGDGQQIEEPIIEKPIIVQPKPVDIEEIKIDSDEVLGGIKKE